MVQELFILPAQIHKMDFLLHGIQVLEYLHTFQPLIGLERIGLIIL